MNVGMAWILSQRWLMAFVCFALATLWAISTAISWVNRDFPGFLLLDNGVVASAGLTNWPAVSDGRIFQTKLVTYDGRRFSGHEEFRNYIDELGPGIPVAYVFESSDIEIHETIETRTLSKIETVLFFGAALVAALALLGVSLALMYMAPNDPASLGCALALGVSGTWALTAVDLYGPYHLFRLHALAECMLPAASFHMALVFPHQIDIAMEVLVNDNDEQSFRCT